MGKLGRPPVLDDGKKRDILTILSVGCSRRIAAGYVGCHPDTIQNTAERDPVFAEQLSRALYLAGVSNLTNIQQAGKEGRYWRAAAWLLERRYPEEFGTRRPELMTPKQMHQVVVQFAEILAAEIPQAKVRQRVLTRLFELAESFQSAAGAKEEDHASQ